MKWSSRNFSFALVVAMLSCSCRHVSETPPVGSDDGRATIMVTKEMGDKHTAAAWLAYGIALSTKRQGANLFEREVYARTTAAEVWRELKQKEKVKPNPDLDALAKVEARGFMREYVWHYLRHPEWEAPENLRLAEFTGWKNDQLQSHTPVTDPGVRLAEPTR